MAAIKSVTDIARHFSAYLNRVAFHGERFVLVRGKRAVAELRPVAPMVRAAELPALFEDLPHLDDAEAAALEADIARARAELRAAPVRDLWD